MLRLLTAKNDDYEPRFYMTSNFLYLSFSTLCMDYSSLVEN